MFSKKKKVFSVLMALFIISAGTVALAANQPNILVVWGDDIGQSNISAYTHGLMGYKTPNIDRIANEGMTFTDYYGEQSCTAGRSSFITGQSVFRTGLSKVGLPGADLGLREEDPTIAALLKARGYATGQFGKNHLGDKDEFLPTNHGFDEFFGNLYHLNAEEAPEQEDYPKYPAFRKRFGPRGVIHSYADGRIACGRKEEPCTRVSRAGISSRARRSPVSPRSPCRGRAHDGPRTRSCSTPRSASAGWAGPT